MSMPPESRHLQNLDTCLLAKVSGRSIQRLFESDLFNAALCEHIATNPVIAVDRIRTKYGVAKNFSPWDISEFILICDALAGWVDHEAESVKLVMQAPHTHWDLNKPILYAFDPRQFRYIVGNQPLVPEGEYCPVSFVRHKNGIIPFEWAEESCLEHIDLKLNYGLLVEIFSRHLDSDSVIGMGIDYRFSWLPSQPGSVEFPISDDPLWVGLSQIIDVETFLSQGHVLQETETVAWKCDLSGMAGLSANERIIAQKARELLQRTCSLEGRLTLLRSLQSREKRQ